MKRFFILVIVLSLAAGVTLVAQEHNNAVEKKATDEIQISTPVKIGTATLEPARYRIACDRTEMTFTRVSNDEKVLSVPCKGKELPQKAANTEIHTSLNKEGVRVVDKLLLRGSNVEHLF